MFELGLQILTANLTVEGFFELVVKQLLAEYTVRLVNHPLSKS